MTLTKSPFEYAGPITLYSFRVRVLSFSLPIKLLRSASGPNFGEGAAILIPWKQYPEDIARIFYESNFAAGNLFLSQEEKNQGWADNGVKEISLRLNKENFFVQRSYILIIFQGTEP